MFGNWLTGFRNSERKLIVVGVPAFLGLFGVHGMFFWFLKGNDLFILFHATFMGIYWLRFRTLLQCEDAKVTIQFEQ